MSRYWEEEIERGWAAVGKAFGRQVERRKMAKGRLVADDARGENPTSAWHPIETAPKDGTVFIGLRLIGTGCGASEDAPEWMVSDASWLDGRYRFRDVMSWRPTHWMPMPEPPHA